MQYEDGVNRTTDPGVDDTDRPVPQPDPEHPEDSEQPEDSERPADSDDGGEALAEYSVVEDTHPTNVQPVSPDLGGVQPVDPVGTGEPVDESDTDGLAPDEADPLRTRWREAQHLFVDDPAGAVHEAAALVQEAAERATSATRAESGTDPGAQSSPDTEQLRITMRRYHEAFELLIGISTRETV